MYDVVTILDYYFYQRVGLSGLLTSPGLLFLAILHETFPPSKKGKGKSKSGSG